MILSDLSDPAPPNPGPAQRAAVAGRARQLRRRRRLAQVGGTLAVVALLGAGAVAITATGSTGTAGKVDVAAASTATVFGHAVNVPDGATFTVTLTGESGTFSATADEAGAFSLDQVPPGDYRVTWQWENADGTAVQVGRLPQPVTLSGGRNTMSVPTL